MDWFRQQYPNSEATPLLIHPERSFDSHAAIPTNCRIIATQQLDCLRKSLSAFASGLAANDAFRDPARVTDLLHCHRLDTANFVSHFSVPGRH